MRSFRETARLSTASPLSTKSAITGESAPVIRESGGDRSAVTGGTKVLSDRIVIKITSNPGETFLDRMIALVEGAQRQKTPNEIGALNPAGRPHYCVPSGYCNASAIRYLQCARGGWRWQRTYNNGPDIPAGMSYSNTIGGLLSAIGIAGMDA